jgi:hypothetical protein
VKRGKGGNRKKGVQGRKRGGRESRDLCTGTNFFRGLGDIVLTILLKFTQIGFKLKK